MICRRSCAAPRIASPTSSRGAALREPIKCDFRLSRAPATIGGVEIPAGTTLMVHFGAANRDPRQFENPDVFDPERANAGRQIGFDRGIHCCIGAPLARAEGRVLLERLLERTGTVDIDEDKHGPAHNRRFRYEGAHSP